MESTRPDGTLMALEKKKKNFARLELSLTGLMTTKKTAKLLYHAIRKTKRSREWDKKKIATKTWYECVAAGSAP